MADSRLVRLKRGDPKRGFLLSRYTYNGIKFTRDRGWYRVNKDTADYLAGVRQVAGDEQSRPAFDVCTDEEAKAMDERESREDRPTLATEAVRVVEPRSPEPKVDRKAEPSSGPRARPAEEGDRPTAAASGRRSKSTPA